MARGSITTFCLVVLIAFDPLGTAWATAAAVGTEFRPRLPVSVLGEYIETAGYCLAMSGSAGGHTNAITTQQNPSIESCMAACSAATSCSAFDVAVPFNGTCWQLAPGQAFYNGTKGNGLEGGRCYVIPVGFPIAFEAISVMSETALPNLKSGYKSQATVDGWGRAGAISTVHSHFAGPLGGFSFVVPSDDILMRIGLITAPTTGSASPTGMSWYYQIGADGRYMVYNVATSHGYRGAYRRGDQFEMRLWNDLDSSSQSQFHSNMKVHPVTHFVLYVVFSFCASRLCLLKL